MSGPFIDLPLTTGNYFTQTRQRQMNTNSKVPWERSARANLPYDDFTGVRHPSTNPAGTLAISVLIDTSTIDSTTASGGTNDLKLADIDISAITVGLHTFQVKVVSSAAGGFTVSGKVLRFVKHEYMNRLSVWLHLTNSTSLVPPNDYTQEITAGDVSVIIHESVQSW